MDLFLHWGTDGEGKIILCINDSVDHEAENPKHFIGSTVLGGIDVF